MSLCGVWFILTGDVETSPGFTIRNASLFKSKPCHKFLCFRKYEESGISATKGSWCFLVIVEIKGDDIYKASTSPQSLVGPDNITSLPHGQPPAALLRAPPWAWPPWPVPIQVPGAQTLPSLSLTTLSHTPMPSPEDLSCSICEPSLTGPEISGTSTSLSEGSLTGQGLLLLSQIWQVWSHWGPWILV